MAPSAAAKKRKAAAAKKHKKHLLQNPPHSNNHLPSHHGTDHLKHHQEFRDSSSSSDAAGEVTNNGSKAEVGQGSNIVVVDKDNVVRVDKESDKKDQTFDRVDHETESGSSSSGLNNSSDDDESRDVFKTSSHDQAVADESQVSVEKAQVGSSSVVKSVVKVNGEDKVGTSNGEEEEIVQYVENIVTNPEPKECVAQESGDREKDSGFNELFMARGSHAVQTTSWMSCCGLFEVLKGSG